jgi:dTDP-L-rhamnose 4-epimerase
LKGIDSVVHLAAEVGVGQSMYAVERYTSVNETGSAVLFEALIDHPVRRVITASSMSIYGEGLYRDLDGNLVENAERKPRVNGEGWDPRDAEGRPLSPIATPEWKQPSLASIYALGKYVQERQTLIMTEAYGMEGACLRLFNVYGPGQALSNPYTGVLAIFASRLLNRRPPIIYEDGRQRRDFVSVYDVARALRLALEAPAAPGQAFNVGSGQSASVIEIAERMAAVLDAEDIAPQITGQYRVGDIRHCFADITHARTVLGYQPQITLEAGLMELAGWLSGQQVADRVDQANAELAARGLTV